MRSGCSLPSTVLLLLLLGLGVWGIRHWQPSSICSAPFIGWFCDGTGGFTRHIPTTKTEKPPAKKQVVADTTAENPVVDQLATGVAHPFPWPIAEKSIEWSNFREGAYSIPAVATKAVAPKAVKLATGVAHPFPWPIAEKSIKWSNFREGAYSIPAVAPKPVKLATGVPHPFPWPIAKKSIKWSNFREGAYSIPAVAPKPVKLATGVPHPFPWPVAEKSITWTNFRQPPKPKKIVAKKPAYKTVAHPFPWPIAEKPVKWTNVRKVAPAPVPPPSSPSVPYADSFVGYDPAPPRNGLELLVYRVKKEPTRKASDCGAELNRVARAGVILFETSSAKLTGSSYDTLDELAGVAKTCDSVSITVEGHTDNSGSASFNQRLSERRAQSVAAYLQGAGISGESLSAVGYGESRPAFDNTTPENMAKNRRIEFSVSGN